MTYSEKLKDPRWQKRRLEIMSRDAFKCVWCGCAEKTLHVHHESYKAGLEPWEYADDVLQTLCESCHELQHLGLTKLEEALLSTIFHRKVLGDELIDKSIHRMVKALKHG